MILIAIDWLETLAVRILLKLRQPLHIFLWHRYNGISYAYIQHVNIS